MKIKTITCHDVYNTGASLQAYALQHYLCSLGHDVEIIDYKPDYLSRHYSLTAVFNEKYDRPLLKQAYILMKMPERLKERKSLRKKEFDEFRNSFMTLTRRYNSFEALKADPPAADLYFAGSDQIWNTLFQNGKDPAFYLAFAPTGVVKASYAASFSTDEIEEEYKQQVKKWLSDLDYISVREKSGVDIIDRLGIEDAVQVLDPVFLLSADEWRQMEAETKLKDPYLLLYDFDQNPEIAQIARTYASKNSWKIYSILPNNCCDQCFDQYGPRTFLTLVRNAEFVISNSFHATAFSLIFEKNFMVFNRAEKINTRMRDLLDSVGLTSRLCNVQQSGLDAIDYHNVRKKLEALINQSKRYIDTVIEESQNDR